VDIAVTKNGKPNLDVKKIWIDTAATSHGIKVTQSAPYPVAWILGNVFCLQQVEPDASGPPVSPGFAADTRLC